MSYEKMMKWNKKHRKGTKQTVIMHTESGFTPSNSFLNRYFDYMAKCETKKISPADCQDYYKNTKQYNYILSIT